MTRVGLVGIKFQPGEHALRHVGRSPCVIACVSPFAGVVQQAPSGRAPEHEAARAAERQTRDAHSALVRPAALFKPVQRVDEHKGVLIDGVAVIGVADDQSVDAMKLRNEQFEDTQGMHGSEGITSKAARRAQPEGDATTRAPLQDLPKAGGAPARCALRRHDRDDSPSAPWRQISPERSLGHERRHDERPVHNPLQRGSRMMRP